MREAKAARYKVEAEKAKMEIYYKELEKKAKLDDARRKKADKLLIEIHKKRSEERKIAAEI